MKLLSRPKSTLRPKSPQRPRKLKALIIDDEIDVCWLLGNLLNRKNVDWSYAVSLTEADKLLQPESPPSIVFIDNHLPDGLGVNYIMKLKKEYPLTLIVMMTGHDNDSYRKEAFTAGVDYFTSKPFSSEFINNTLDQLIGK